MPFHLDADCFVQHTRLPVDRHREMWLRLSIFSAMMMLSSTTSEREVRLCGAMAERMMLGVGGDRMEPPILSE